MFGSNPQSPSVGRQTDGMSLESSLLGTFTHAETAGMQTSATAIDSEPGSNVEIVSMEEGSAHFSELQSEEQEKPMEITEENDKDMISPEAQRLTGDILHESQLNEEQQEHFQQESSEERLNPHYLSTEGALSPQQLHEDKLPEQESDLDVQGEGLTPAHLESSHSVVDAIEIKTDTIVDQEKEMTSRSSTIFVDMTGLNIESHEADETQD